MFRVIKCYLLLSSCIIGFTLASNAKAMIIYANDFDTPSTIAAGVSATLSGGFLGSVTGGPYNGSNGKSWSGQYFNGDGASATLTLSNLPSHTGASIDLLLGFLNSWDSRDGSDSPDNLNILIDGNLALSMTTTNSQGSIVDFDGGTQLINDGELDGNLNWYFAAPDDLVDMATASALTFAHTAPTLTLQITPAGSGWEGWPNEGWGMDALSVSLNGTNPDVDVPEPASLALLGLGLAGLGFTRRRKRA